MYAGDLTASTFSYEVVGLDFSKEYRFMVKALNHEGIRQSNVVSALVADVPSTPINGPTFSISETDTDSIRVIMPSVSDDGGSQIISYHLQRTEPSSSVFFDVIGSF